MLRRLKMVLLAAVLVVSVPAAPAMAGTYYGNSAGRTRNPDPIWQGLCVGASLDLSTASHVKCIAQEQAAQANKTPAKPPNIEAGLCVGASLDLSLRSQARCVAATQPQQSPPPRTHPKKHHEPQVVVEPESTPPPRSGYAALGDSVAAGLGLPSLSSDPAQCGRTQEAYPYAVANVRGLPLANLACNGANMGDLYTSQHVPGLTIPPQLNGAFAQGVPQLITITAGANDVHWDDFLRKCYARTCGTTFDRTSAAALNTALAKKLRVVMRTIERRSEGSPPQVILTGYYNPLSAQCANIEPRITAEEIAWLDTELQALNQTLANAAVQSSFTVFVPIDFTGHDICSADPWVQTLEDPAPFHPTAKGQQVIARTIVAAN